MNDYEWEFIDDDDLEKINRRRIPLVFKFISLVLLISFLALCFPWLNHFLNDSFELIQQNQALFSKDIVVNAKPAIVSIQTIDSSASKQSKGTGFIVSPRGLIVTNAHVVENAKSVRITLDNDETVFSNLIEIIPDNDLAIIQINKDNLPYLQIEEEQVSIDDIVTIIGNPLWYYKIAQQGKVEAFTKIADSDTPVFYIDIAINPGNSGSPVLNEAGKVVGVVFASIILNDNTKKALAIPIQSLIPYLELNIKNDSV